MRQGRVRRVRLLLFAGLMLCQSGKFACSCCPKAGTYFEVANLTEALEPATFAGGVVDGEPKSTDV